MMVFSQDGAEAFEMSVELYKLRLEEALRECGGDVKTRKDVGEAVGKLVAPPGAYIVKMSKLGKI